MRAALGHSGVKDRGFMDSIYFNDPLGLTDRARALAVPAAAGCTHAEVLLQAHKLRVERGDDNIARPTSPTRSRLLVERSRESLSADRSPQSPY